MKRNVLIIAITIICIFQTFAQPARLEVIASSGDFFSNSSNTLSWTLGECISETFISSGNTLTQGFQQSLYVVTSIHELLVEGISVKAYPNPISDFINISIKTDIDVLKNIGIELYDSQGKVLFLDKYSSNFIQLDMKNYSSGFYVLIVKGQEGKILQNFKIQKIN
jgi:hypothetical protein